MAEPNPTVTESSTTPVSSGAGLRLGNLFAGQLEEAVKQFGGLPAALRRIPEAVPGEAEKGYLGGIQSRAGTPTMRPEETEALSTLKGLSDPTAQVASARNYYEQIAAPEILNAASAQGYGARSGAALEALARGAIPLTLPVVQAANLAGIKSAEAGLQYGKTAEDREVTRLVGAQRAAAIPREAELTERLRPIDTIIRLFGMQPGGPSGSTTRSTQTGGGASPAQLGLQAGSIIANLLANWR